MCAMLARAPLRRWPALGTVSNLQRQAASTKVFAEPEAHRKVENQVNSLGDFNAFKADPCLQDAVLRAGASWATEHLENVGAVAGSTWMQSLAVQANTHRPIIHTHDDRGRRVDMVQYDDSYHTIMDICFSQGVPNYGWTHEAEKGAQSARSALSYMMYQAESGTQCPQTMTFACVPVLRKGLNEEQARYGWAEKAACPDYDPRNVPVYEKEAVTIGMSMTEVQGGSDVRANSTFAEPLKGFEHVRGHLLHGHKWFTSAPMSDGFLTLAQTSEGLSCFLVPRWVPSTGERNQGLQFRRLKNKLGDHSNASSEVEYHGAYAELVGEPGRGVPTIIDMVQHTRLDCLVGSAGLIRRCLSEALHHTSQRAAFGAKLADQPLMKAVLTDLIVDSEAATALAFLVASTFDNDGDKKFGRIATPIGKYYVCKRAPHFAYECLEALGGNGYVEDSIMPRLYRQAPLNAIWEGSGNVIALDVLRSAAREPETVEVLLQRLGSVQGVPAYDAALKRLHGLLHSVQKDMSQARALVGQAAMLLQAYALSLQTNTETFELFCQRLDGGQLAYARDYGTVSYPDTVLRSRLDALHAACVHDDLDSPFSRHQIPSTLKESRTNIMDVQCDNVGLRELRRRLDELMNKLLHQLVAGDSPHFRLPSHVRFDADKGYYRLTTASHLMVRSQSPRFEYILRLCQEMYALIGTHSSRTVRDIFYNGRSSFRTQHDAQQALLDISTLLCVRQEALPVFASNKGLVCGDITLLDSMGRTLISREQAISRSDNLIPSLRAKDTRRIPLASLFENYAHSCSSHCSYSAMPIHTAQRFKPAATRSWRARMPVGSAFGLLTLPAVATIGRQVSILTGFNTLRFDLKAACLPQEGNDFNLLERLLAHPALHPKERAGLQEMATARTKAELEAINVHHPRFLSDRYLPIKVREALQG
ncbi:uncharacterized protein MONBRDRAFT_31227 [Monosiga brevicollis MX1]|uniref:Uncharacterized protein n=1 Tax=Monosiga brevicollis TaxID=81824 RepID=A9USH0_MONBE|nr:uncharacterized protein MONBRDRAFT_31227 [Monosiga brevicollis MX1]EDQ92099.1 predicted protein [Monosiga brevicollis MX1]|eukprot:XP_001743385.1 hypothetical protein [Monosiga brevicollis MX1]